jgi:hypothetical protein
VDFNYSKIYQKGGSTKYAISVQNVDTYMINKEEIIIQDQEITRL